MASPDVQSADLPPVSQLRSALSAACRSDDRGLFVLLDGARVPGLAAILRELRVPHWCLFRESPKENLAHLAPFLAHCQIQGDLPFWLATDEPALEGALFAVAGGGVEELYRHLRRFLLVVDSAGKENYLRFYDPRVLQPFLASSTEAEKRQFFGPIQSFLAHDAEASQTGGSAVLREWRAPRAMPAESPAHPPSATSKFRLSRAHEAEFSRDSMERYDRRCTGFLRSRYSGALAGKTDADVSDLIREAKTLGPALGLPSGRDIAIVSELLVLGFSPEMRSKVLQIPHRDRPRAIQLLRDRLASTAVRAR